MPLSERQRELRRQRKRQKEARKARIRADKAAGKKKAPAAPATAADDKPAS